MKVSAFITHKKSEKYSECQDRFSVSTDTKSIAVSDGMSQSYQQKIWASLLVNSYTGDLSWSPTEENLDILRQVWKSKVLEFIESLRTKGGQEYLVRMNQTALVQQKSAAATFLGIRFSGYKWEGEVLGDTCLIELDEQNNILAIHTSQDKEFDNYPDFFDSTSIRLKQKGAIRKITGELTEGHKLLLVSDPFSDLIQELKNGKVELNVEELLNIKTHADFNELVDRWRSEKNMTNDDTTLVCVTYDSSEEFSLGHIDRLDDLISAENAKIEAANQLNDEEKPVEKAKEFTIPTPESVVPVNKNEPEGGEEKLHDDTSADDTPSPDNPAAENVKAPFPMECSEELIQELLSIHFCGRLRKKKFEKKVREIVAHYNITKDK